MSESPASRHFVIDTTMCARDSEVSIAIRKFGALPVTTALGKAGSCAVYGGASGFAGQTPGAIIVDIAVEQEAMEAYQIAVTVDGAQSDDVHLPDILTGQEWQGAPLPPAQPIRRLDDWSWRVVNMPTADCSLLSE